MSDEDHMRAALALARRGLGQTAPNPSVGCVIVKAGHVVGRGFTAPGGRPHAEVRALTMAGTQAQGGTAYVTLEPCNFIGKSGACTESLIRAGLARVVIGAQDPHPQVNGSGIARLRAAGLDVADSVLQSACEAVIAGFSMVQRARRPLLRLKLASSLDGRIATAKGESQWITGDLARRAVHIMRGRHDAVMVGVGTILADDPDLTCRIDGMRTTSLVRIVVDSHLRTPMLSRLVQTANQHPLWILHHDGVDPARCKALSQVGVKLIGLPATKAGIDLKQAMEQLAAHGLTRILVEGGGTLAAGLLQADLVDRLAWFHAPGILGGDGFPAVAGLGVETLLQIPRFAPVSACRLGADMLSHYTRL